MPRKWLKPPADNYQELLLKSIPSEVIGLYLTIHSLLLSLKDRPAALMWVMMGLCTAVTPLFLWKSNSKVPETERMGPTQYVIATLAVPVWLMGIPGSGWFTIDGWQPWIGGLAVILYAGLLSPLVAFLATRLAD